MFVFPVETKYENNVIVLGGKIACKEFQRILVGQLQGSQKS